MAIILLRAHIDNAPARHLLATLRAAALPYDIVVVSHLGDTADRAGMLADAYVITDAEARALPYPARADHPRPADWSGYHDLAVMRYFLDHPRHDFYWIVEYDVFYSGDWAALLAELATSDADLLGTTVQREADNPDWCYWNSLQILERPLPPQHRVKTFTPFVRLSGAALRAIHSRYLAGLDGHFEATWATACSLAGLRIEDIGGEGPFTPPRWRGKHYVNASLDPWLRPGTFVFRPAFALEALESMAPGLGRWLWHPVKS